MATENATGKPTRFVGGPRAIGALLPSVTRAAFGARAAASAQLMADWTGIVGPALGAVTFPRRLASGTLTLACAGPVALELQHLAGPLADRINAYFGRPLVQHFRFVQDAVAAQPSPPTRRAAVPSPIPVPDMEPGPLRDALAALGGAVAAAAGRDPA